MRKTAIFIFLFISGVVTAQHNALYLTFSPMDRGFGARFDHKSVYTSLSYGKYEHLDGCHINTHFKAAVGYVKELQVSKDGYHYYWLAGGSYHVYRGISEDITRRYLFPVSLEIGAGVRKDHFKLGLRLDSKHNVNIDLGFTFNL
jgi:hypothetical protein